MEKKSYIKFKCLEVQQPIGIFYMGIMDYRDLLYIAYADVRRLETGGSEREVETYIGIQRPLSPVRVKEINKYVNLSDSTFPTSIILAVSAKDADYDKATNTMQLRNDKNVAKVLDGQHRIAGLEDCKYESDRFQLNVIIFIDVEIEDQAIVFATINKTQTKVNKSLVADLFEFAKTRSPQKTAHNIARALNQKPGSPFYEKIKILGVAEEKEKETITQATFVESILNYITSDMMTDRDLYKRNLTPERVPDNRLTQKFFRNMFIDEEDGKIAQIINNYFLAVQKKWPEAWNEVKVDNILNKSTGFVALMKFLKDAYLSFNRIGKVITVDEFREIFKKIYLKNEDFNKGKYKPGGIGQSDLYKDLLSQSGLSKQ